MSVFTIFNHGTDFHRNKQSSEIISILSEAMRGEEALIIKDDSAPLGFSLQHANPTYMICEGCGSDTVEEGGAHSSVGHTWPGNDNPITREQAKDGLIRQQDNLTKEPWYKGGGYSDFQKSFCGDTPRPWQLSGRTTGAGWNDNAYKAVWMLTHLLFGDNPQNIRTVNIIGWSRGAVTCLKQAYLLNEVLPQLKVNILALDPVPGMDPVKHEVDTRTLTPNIDTYWAVAALNEHRMNFRTIGPELIVDQSSNAWIEFLPMPGNHSDVVRPNNDTKSWLRYLGENIAGTFTSKSYMNTLSLAYRFLCYFGTTIKAVDMLNNAECLFLYDQMLEDFNDITEEYRNATDWKDASSYRVGSRYGDREVLSAFLKAQKTVPQAQDKLEPYTPYVMKGWINLHHWILARNSLGQVANPNLDHPYVHVAPERIEKWQAFIDGRLAISLD
ncbi:TPA: hypothetical protein I6209_000281 [Vibrio cholerae]|nr:hypothetical protein F0Q18_10490 [Vibrio cholerae]HAS3627817.1 hypothetical protein [Vibrio cholerae]